MNKYLNKFLGRQAKPQIKPQLTKRQVVTQVFDLVREMDMSHDCQRFRRMTTETLTDAQVEKLFSQLKKNIKFYASGK